MKAKLQILCIFLILMGCKVRRPLVEGNVDANGYATTVLAFRVFIDGKLKSDGHYWNVKTNRNTSDTVLRALQYGDLNFLVFNTKVIPKLDGMAPKQIQNRSDLKIGELSMTLMIEPQLIGNHIYIDSLPLQPGRFIIDSIKTIKKRSLYMRYSKLIKIQELKKIIPKGKLLDFRRSFALDSNSKQDPIEQLLRQRFIEIKYSDLTKWEGRY